MIEIREATPKDIEGIVDVQVATWRTTYPNKEKGITPEDIEELLSRKSREARIKSWQESLVSSDNKVFVAIDSGQVVGFCGAYVYEDKNKLRATYILPTYQGQGIGYRFWQRAKEFFDPAKDIYVEVAVYNETAISFYKSHGFVETGRQCIEESLKMKSGASIEQMEMCIKAPWK